MAPGMPRRLRLAGLSLRFASGDKEASFLAAHQQFLPLIGLALNLLGLAVVCSQALPILALENGRAGPASLSSASLGDPRLPTLACWMGQCGLAALCAVVICCSDADVRCFLSQAPKADQVSITNSASRRSYQFVENLLIAFCFVFGAGSCLANRLHGAALMGEDPETVWGDEISVIRDEELVIAFRLCCELVAVGLFVPLRVSVMWIHHLLIPLLFSVATGVGGSSHPSVASSMCLLLFLVSGMTLASAYRMERMARELWKARAKGEPHRSDVYMMHTDVHDEQRQLVKHDGITTATATVLDLRKAAADASSVSYTSVSDAESLAAAVIGAQMPFNLAGTESADGTGDSWVSLALAMSGTAGEGEASFIFDAGAEGMPILICSDVFTRLVAPSCADGDGQDCDVLGLRFLDWLEDGPRFQEWLHDGVRELDRTGSEVVSAFLTLRPPLALELGIELRVLFRFRLVPPSLLSDAAMEHLEPKLPVLALVGRVRCRNLRLAARHVAL